MATKRPSSCLFCDMVRGRIGSNAVFETERLMAFLDIHPIRRGHVQVIPREHFAYFEDLPSEIAGEIVVLAQKIARAQKRLYRVERVAFLFAGGDIAHVHAHVVPMMEKTDITSRRYIKEEVLTFAPTAQASHEELNAVAIELKDAIEAL
jgi:histidine triad (HIT) family protein